MTIADFKAKPLNITIKKWTDAQDGVLIEATHAPYYIRLTKRNERFDLLISNPAMQKYPWHKEELDLRCGCPYADRWHWHHTESFDNSEKASETTEWAIFAIEQGVSVKLANSTQIPF